MENGYIDSELRSAITRFQSDKGLRIDGRMNPGGETEATVISQMMGLPEPDKAPRTIPTNKNLRHEAAAPIAVPLGVRGLMGVMGAYGIGKSLQESWEQWQNMDTDGREKIVDTAQCDRMYAYETQSCNNTTNKKGTKAGAICHQSAANRYAACLAGKPDDLWPELQEYEG